MKLLRKTRTINSDLVDKFSALGDKTRIKLLQLLIEDDGICVSELAQEINISNAGVSQQLKVMEQAGLIVRKRNGQKICYRVDTNNTENKQILDLLNK